MKKVSKKGYLMRELEKQFKKVENQKLKQGIRECIGCRIICYHRFLITKIGLIDIKHRKIVQKIFSKYLPGRQSIKLYCLSLGAKNQAEKLKWLEQGMKLLPNSLQSLELDLGDNVLGNKVENLQYIGELMMQLPANLQSFELLLNVNNLGENSDNLKYLFERMQKLPFNLQNLELDLSFNNIGKNDENLKQLGEGMKWLPSNLKSFKLSLKANEIRGNIQAFKELGEGVKQLPGKLEVLVLNFQWNFDLDFQALYRLKQDCLRGQARNQMDIIFNYL